MRGWLKTTIGLVVLSGVLVGADRIAVGVAEDEAADQILKSGRMSQKPHVSIEGFPFLTQVVTQKLDDVRISADGLTVGEGKDKVALHSFSARLSGVEVSDNMSSATVDTGSGSGLIDYADLSRLLPPASELVPNAGRLSLGGGTRLSLSYGGPGKVKASLGPFPVGEASVHNKGNTVTVDGFRISAMASLLAGVSDQAIAPISFTLAALPAGLNLASVTPQEEGFRLAFEGKDVRLIG
ncbi:DUF2993 domain-containing protein [Kitasatospora purpeofusca]|uniref:LmeA family phospholipid-binding protein n=1 Tax=Kitasatospora purpeofusca TaxID=67352 RepID=UPI00224ECD18|nr:DUF2993 domain-containing protein [Kitasatospora purpeofusca]MCX4686408.1 DUF2993 domain-containing protein [Kitasatospora purpeofusca]